MSKLTLPTKYGGIPYLNDFLLSKIPYNSISISYGELLNNIDIFPKFKQSKSSVKVLNDYFNLKEKTTILNIFNNKEHSEDYGMSDETGFSLKTSNGKGSVSFEKYISDVNVLCPDYAVVPYEYIDEKNEGSKKFKRNKSKVFGFVKELLKRNENEKENEVKYIFPLFLYSNTESQGFSVEFNNEEKNLIKSLYDKELLGGFALFTKGFSSFSSENEMNDYIEKSKSTVNSNLSFLSSSSSSSKSKDFLIYHISKSSHPFDCLLGISIGVNLYDSSFIFDISEKANLLLFSTENPSFPIDKLDLSTKEFSEDTSVLVRNCKCFSCQNEYTKAYINHLFKCNELNGPIILLLHNIYVYDSIMKGFESKNDDERKGILNGILLNK